MALKSLMVLAVRQICRGWAKIAPYLVKDSALMAGFMVIELLKSIKSMS
ncbi:hypothetical protein [Maritalea sp. S77]